MARSRFSAASQEVARKTEAQLERETALNWTARAKACFEHVRSSKDLGWLQRGRDYHHEALEHGALVHDGGKLVARIDALLLKALKSAEARAEV